MRFSEIQEELRKQGLDGWLFFDHHERDPLAYRILQFSPRRHVTRRWYYFLPAAGEPRALVHRIEREMLDDLPGTKQSYSQWSEQEQGIAELLRGAHRIAMQYSPKCAIPYISLIDGGTLELIRGTGVEVVSSGELVQIFEARWNRQQLDSHLEAGRRIDEIRRRAFEFVADRLTATGTTSEIEVKEFILGAFRTADLVTDDGPIVAVNGNAGDPHYQPSAGRFEKIRRDDFLLIDMWAKLNRPGCVYYDITWTGFCGSHPPEGIREVFAIVRSARDAAIRAVEQAISAGRPIHGYEVDDAARDVIRKKGFAQHFTHRTGHSIGQEVHGTGANMDNLETHDDRRIIPWTCFSIEPGIYLKDFGVRSEVNVFVADDAARVTGEVQQELVLL